MSGNAETPDRQCRGCGVYGIPDGADYCRTCDEDDGRCGCQQAGCPECDRWCHYCGGDGWGIVGTDWDTDDAINGPYAGEIEECPCCHGSGLAKDCTFW